MKRQVIIVMCVAALFLFFSQAGFAQDAGKFGIGLRGSYFNIETGAVVPSDPKVDPTYLSEVNLTYFLDEGFSLELSAGHATADVFMTIPGIPGIRKQGELTQVPILLTGRFHSPNGSVLPYVGGGLGYYLNSFEGESGVSGYDFNNSFGAHVVAGLELFLLKNIALNLDAKYVFWNNTEFRTPTESDEFNLETYSIGGGFKYYF